MSQKSAVIWTRFLYDQYHEVPWRKVVGMRDKVIHDYLGVDEETVWRTVHEDLPPLREAVRKLLDEL